MTALEAGATLEPLALPKISRTTLALFAGASGDHNSMHIDIDAARAAGMDDVFAQGMLSMALLGRFITDLVPIEKLRSYSVRFVAITPVLAEPTCSGHVVDVSVVDGEERATLELAMTLSDGTTTIVGQAVVAI